MSALAEEQTDPASICRRLVRQSATAALATLEQDGKGGAGPYASLVLIAAAHDAAPLLLLSDLADHSKNIARDSRVSLLFDGTHGLDSPLTGARVTLQGRADALDNSEPAQRLKRRYLARHPDAAGYAGFADFKFYGVRPERFHLVAGFGRISWLAAGDVLLDAIATGTLAEEEEGILAHMNEDHGDAVDLYAHTLAPEAPSGWRMTGIDPEGADLRREAAVLRLNFGDPIRDGASARRELVRLVKAFKADAAGGGNA